ncbi:MAG: CorA family divalent cation transporter [Bacteroidota bacterium]
MKSKIWKSDHVRWIDITSPTHEELKEYSKQFNLDYYTLSDCLEPAHLPKKEQLEDFTFIILRVYDRNAPKYPTTIQEMSHKVAIFYNDKVMLTVHRVHEEIIDEIRTLYLDAGLISKPSEIVTKIMYYAVKSYEANAIVLSEEVDQMEKQVFVGKQTRVTLEELYFLKSSSRLNRRIIGLTREVILQHTTTEGDASALQDVKDLLQKLSLSFDETHDDSANLSTVYLSIVSSKTNDVMKLLTIFSVFFMPLTFIAGIYGMNFEFMPELHWKQGYPLVLLIMSLIGVGIFIWFKRKNVIQ